MNLSELTKPLYAEGTPDSYTITGSYEPYPLTSREYLKFADEDIKTIELLHSRVNAMGNIKRSIDCRIDAVLDLWTLRRKNDTRLDFIEKVELLNGMGVVTPRLIRKINTYRNNVEHIYEIPDIEKVYDYRDTAELFLGYTDKYLQFELDERYGLSIMNHDCFCETPTSDGECQFGAAIDSLNIKLDRKKRQLALEFRSGSDSTKDCEFIIKHTDRENFLYVINLWYVSLHRHH